MYTYKYPHAALTADSVVFTKEDGKISVLLVERKQQPYKGAWALPGGFMNIDETIERCAQRELREETNLERVPLRQLGVWSAVDRDPRERVVTVAFYGMVTQSGYRPIGGDDAAQAQWFAVDHLPSLAFDHNDIIHVALERLLTDSVDFPRLSHSIIND